MKNILFITDTPPTAKRGGGTIGFMHYKIVQNLSANKAFNLFICSEVDKRISENDYMIRKSSTLEKIITALLGYPPYISLRTRNFIFWTIERRNIELIYIDNSISGKLIENIKTRYPKVAVISFFHDIEQILLREQMKTVGFLRTLSLKTMICNEEQTVRYADRTIVLNKRDAELYYQCYSKMPDALVPIIVPTVEGLDIETTHSAGGKLKLLFVGVDYPPNVGGMRWFLTNVLPLMECDYELAVVGFGMEKYKEEFEAAGKGVCVHGTVDNLKPFYQDADAVIAPIFEGGGMKVKTAEALSYGKTFIGTGESLIGYIDTMPDELRENGVYHRERADDFAVCMDTLCGQTFPKCRTDIQNWMIKEYSYETNLERYREVFESV